VAVYCSALCNVLECAVVCSRIYPFRSSTCVAHVNIAEVSRSTDEGIAQANGACNTLQHNPTRCNTLQHTNKGYRTSKFNLQHTATRYSMLQHAATRCNTLQHTDKGYRKPHATRSAEGCPKCKLLQSIAVYCSMLHIYELHFLAMTHAYVCRICTHIWCMLFLYIHKYLTKM